MTAQVIIRNYFYYCVGDSKRWYSRQRKLDLPLQYFLRLDIFMVKEREYINGFGCPHAADMEKDHVLLKLER